MICKGACGQAGEKRWPSAGFWPPLTSSTPLVNRGQLLHWQHARGRHRDIRAAALDSAPEWTLDQIAGLAFGGLLAATFFLAAKVDTI
ncbi:hypothetical protein WJX73_005345 [Symbiochloris irregularis]|uniref:Uncharacterized protein n=1 Tax=Symbiochloris irregularis TaxID=706552 RepID=A0AAW1NQL6_9CHLO